MRAWRAQVLLAGRETRRVACPFAEERGPADAFSRATLGFTPLANTECARGRQGLLFLLCCLSSPLCICFVVCCGLCRLGRTCMSHDTQGKPGAKPSCRVWWRLGGRGGLLSTGSTPPSCFAPCFADNRTPANFEKVSSACAWLCTKCGVRLKNSKKKSTGSDHRTNSPAHATNPPMNLVLSVQLSLLGFCFFNRS